MKKSTGLIVFLLYNQVLIAQNSVGETSSVSGSNWFSSPWLWVAVAAVFILMLLALTGGGKKQDF